eukprot:CAMPEP_0204048010 /NCGR_PEP_ID=MMETSP0360-20130528/114659_1 /ASSEMBLY_ACC=CAM_ASM_000342 /TAXON_ID=268821 /ORGANISM="Scrippsiella Hangoei, Strain SHTV-5" /LENGTH=37 /DNA_ID= /DNA_START= /DNA_END= /DNA_ORIENTATION=
MPPFGRLALACLSTPPLKGRVNTLARDLVDFERLMHG